MSEVRCPSCASPNVEQIDVNKYECPYCGLSFTAREAFATQQMCEQTIEISAVEVHRNTETELVSEKAHRENPPQRKNGKKVWKVIILILVLLVGIVLVCYIVNTDTYNTTCDVDKYDLPIEETIDSLDGDDDLNEFVIDTMSVDTICYEDEYQRTYSGLTFRTFTEKEYDSSNRISYQARLGEEQINAHLQELGFELIDSKNETRLNYTGEDYYETTINIYSITKHGRVTTVKLEDYFTEIHFPSLDDVEEFKEYIKACGLKEVENGYEDPTDCHWAGTDVSIKGTIVTLNYRWEP